MRLPAISQNPSDFGTLHELLLIVEEEPMDLKNCSFSLALEYVKDGFEIRRENWLKDERYVFLQKGATLEALNKLNETVPVIISDNLVIRSEDGNTFEPYIPSTGDLLAEDWIMTQLPTIALEGSFSLPF